MTQDRGSVAISRNVSVAPTPHGRLLAPHASHGCLTHLMGASLISRVLLTCRTGGAVSVSGAARSRRRRPGARHAGSEAGRARGGGRAGSEAAAAAGCQARAHAIRPRNAVHGWVQARGWGVSVDAGVSGSGRGLHTTVWGGMAKCDDKGRARFARWLASHSYCPHVHKPAGPLAPTIALGHLLTLLPALLLLPLAIPRLPMFPVL